MKIVLVGLLLLGLASCSSEQDPIKAEPEDIRKAVPSNGRGKVSRAPCPKNSMVLDSADHVEFVEGFENEFEIVGRTVDCNISDFKIELMNPPDGATHEFDGTKLVLKWAPSDVYVSDGSYFSKGVLRFKMTSNAQTISVINKEVVYFVQRNVDRKPEILDYETPSNGIEEGESGEIFIKVKDLDSSYGSASSAKPPKLNIVTTRSNETNGAYFLDVMNESNPDQDPNDPTVWTFRLYMNTYGDNIVERDQSLSFGAYAVSRYGVKSDIKNVNFKLRNRVIEPKISWPKKNRHRVYFEIGKKNSYHFWVFDPRDEGKVTASMPDTCNNLPGKASCECTHIGTGRWNEEGTYCTIDWDIPKGVTMQSIAVKVDAENQNFDDRTNVEKQSFFRYIYLEKPSTPNGVGL